MWSTKSDHGVFQHSINDLNVADEVFFIKSSYHLAVCEPTVVNQKLNHECKYDCSELEFLYCVI